jgi:phosphonate transport system ATP-binding protein
VQVTFRSAQLTVRHLPQRRRRALHALDLRWPRASRWRSSAPRAPARPPCCRRWPARTAVGRRFEALGQDPWALGPARVAPPARAPVPGAAGAAAAAAPARGDLGAGGAPAAHGAVAPACVPGQAGRSGSRHAPWRASAWATSCMRASTACPAANASAAAWRALLVAGRGLLVDEPLSALDPTLADDLATLQQEAGRPQRHAGLQPAPGRHGARPFPRIVGLRDGRIVFDLPREQVTTR